MRRLVLLCVLSFAVSIVPSASRSAEIAPGLSVGGELRLRAEGLDNALDLSDAAHDSYEYYRLRPRLWIDAKPRETLRLYFRVANEYRWGRGELTAGLRDPEAKLALDNGWARWGRETGPSLTFGRMDLAYGEGFLIFDGTPADGSASSYFDAIVGSWRFASGTVDLLGMKMDDEAMGTAARDEDLIGVYATRAPVEAYALHREKRRATVTATGIVHAKRMTTALGARASHLPATGWRGAAEAAWESGECGGNGAGGAGGYARGGWTAATRTKPAIEAGGLYLSGDDPGTSRDEAWDPLYADWPKYSELLIYTMGDITSRVPGDDAGSWTNVSMAWLEARWEPAARAAASLRATVLRAPEATGAGGGHDRGVLVGGQLNIAFAPDVTGHLLGEYFDPGDFYARGADPAWYGRWQMTARF